MIDMDGNIGIQIVPGTGTEAGASADATAYVAVYPGMESITDAEGFGTEIGGSFGEGFVGSLAALFAGEGNDTELVGGYIGIGIGGEGTVAGRTRCHVKNIFNNPPWKYIYEQDGPDHRNMRTVAENHGIKKRGMNHEPVYIQYFFYFSSIYGMDAGMYIKIQKMASP